MVCLGGYVGDDAYGKFGWWPMFYAWVVLMDRFME
jgi:hypothetical protein